MFDEQIEELASILKNKDLKEYAGEEFLKLIQAVICKDPVGG